MIIWRINSCKVLARRRKGETFNSIHQFSFNFVQHLHWNRIPDENFWFLSNFSSSDCFEVWTKCHSCNIIRMFVKVSLRSDLFVLVIGIFNPCLDHTKSCCWICDTIISEETNILFWFKSSVPVHPVNWSLNAWRLILVFGHLYETCGCFDLLLPWFHCKELITNIIFKLVKTEVKQFWLLSIVSCFFYLFLVFNLSLVF